MPHAFGRSRVALVALVLMASTVSCSDDVLAPAPLPVLATAEPGHVRIENRGTEPIFSFVAERALLPAILWATCLEPGCGQVLPGEVRVVPNSEIGEPGTETSVFWWAAVRTQGGARVPGRFDGNIVQLIPSDAAP